MHTIHGRAPAVATGVSVSNPDLSVWVVSGDGDALSIGGNHLIHALRKNINVKILMFNNQIYGLTKGQYSPTSEEGKKTKSSPFGSVEMPLNPMSLALGAEATFVARSIDMDRDLTAGILEEAKNHKGSAFIEIYQNCNVFNDKAFEQLTNKETKVANRINLVHGQKTVFGSDDHKAVVIRDGMAEIVDTKDVDESEIYVHNIYEENPSIAFSLSRLSHGPYGPTPLGIFRKVQRDSFTEEVHGQIEDAKEKKGEGDIDKLIRSLGTWDVG